MITKRIVKRRNLAIWRLYQTGATLGAVGQAYGISKARVSQIVSAVDGIPKQKADYAPPLPENAKPWVREAWPRLQTRAKKAVLFNMDDLDDGDPRIHERRYWLRTPNCGTGTIAELAEVFGFESRNAGAATMSTKQPTEKAQGGIMMTALAVLDLMLGLYDDGNVQAVVGDIKRLRIEQRLTPMQRMEVFTRFLTGAHEEANRLRSRTATTFINDMTERLQLVANEPEPPSERKVVVISSPRVVPQG